MIHGMQQLKEGQLNISTAELRKILAPGMLTRFLWVKNGPTGLHPWILFWDTAE